jgi:hypothetical protein
MNEGIGKLNRGKRNKQNGRNKNCCDWLYSFELRVTNRKEKKKISHIKTLPILFVFRFKEAEIEPEI